MSIFDYPRINFSGYIAFDPGTANNDDYAQGGQVTLPKTPQYGDYGGEVLGLIDSLLVKPRTFGMDDATFIDWAQHAQTFDTSSGPQQIIPAEWNYYGPQTMYIDSTSNLHSNLIQSAVTGVQTGPNANQDFRSPDATAPVSALVGQPLTLKGHITDINSEGSPPATQFFVDQIQLGTTAAIQGFSKGVGLWLNFYRNVNLTADGGAGAYVYHVLPKAQLGPLAAYFTDANLQGVVFRYYLYRAQLLGSNDDLQNSLYPAHAQNPAPLQIMGTIAPWYEGEEITTAPVGRLLTMDEVRMETLPKNNNGGGKVALAPAVLQIKSGRVSVDFSGTFPEFYHDMQTNPKYNFGPMYLMATDGTNTVDLGQINYSDTAAGNALGWVFDFPIPTSKEALQLFQVSNLGNVTFSVQWEGVTIMEETEYYFVSNQLAVYGEQNGSGTQFNNQATQEEIKVTVYSKGVELTAATCPPISVWEYRTNPIQSPGDANLISTDFAPGQSLSVDTALPGNFLFTFAINPPEGFPPENYNGFMNPPFTTMTNSPMISLRLLPNDVDFSQYYNDPTDPEHSANELLTFDVVYEHALRTYYLLYPAMNYQAFMLNDCASVAQNASGILYVTDPANWMSASYMPRTRDLSDSRRILLRAWCNKVIAMQASGQNPCE